MSVQNLGASSRFRRPLFNVTELAGYKAQSMPLRLMPPKQ
ncbi:hypothetical protein NEILACOT_05655 [Neisseria lactamica ATCC 23970]|uniref:Uncharacterized protein n=1 Tax=Neisseria lactamica ATCC 23970 TaxID=546265 RepID=D0WDL8_NEILA|nr:hypothetical protein NEILACOT_05759 [Neisseria lactamica ATCC 23970]EEZ74235.1 hypothetical protein NEILACOT_05747 [Neisseria lactamica ATCC 23970]EEZ74333.1 hypothetical protein NEILACOT_05655 [Neisseria lactamica ATCC 23970]